MLKYPHIAVRKIRFLIALIICVLIALLVVGGVGGARILSVEIWWTIQSILLLVTVGLVLLLVRFGWRYQKQLVESIQQQHKDKVHMLGLSSATLRSLCDFVLKDNQMTDFTAPLKQSIQLLQRLVDAHKVVVKIYGCNGDVKINEYVGEWSHHGTVDQEHVVKVPIQFKEHVHGQFELYLKHSVDLPCELTQILSSMGRSVGMVVERGNQNQEMARLFRVEERTHIANELHDSLAQTVASLRFQVRILDELLHQGDESTIWAQMERVESMMDEAHSELRGLIGYFRAPIDPRGLIPALKAMVARFKIETGISIYFHNQWGDLVLPNEWEVQLIRIIQEALVNIRKHSAANMVRVLFRVQGDGSYFVLVEDDGCGMFDSVESNQPGEHIGLSVMRERASELGAELTIESEPGEGTRILLSFSFP